MASLVSWLKYSGARKTDGTPVASGRAYFYVPGTSNTFASVYSDVDGLIPLAVPVVLDAAGKAEVYSKSVVHVEVYDAAGAIVSLSDRANTVTAAQVEIENAIATGTDLVTGQLVAGGRTDLNAFLSNLYISLGTTDGKVLVGGNGQNIKDLLSGTTAVWFSVQNTAYGGGAKGNDTADDTAAIQAAINAANSAGGGIVYFPPGTYKVTAAVTVPSGKVWLLGVDPTGSIIKTYSASSVFSTTSGVSCWNLGFTQDAATGNAMFGGGLSTARFINCNFTVTAANTLITLSALNTVASFQNCAFTMSAASSVMFSTTGGTNSLAFVNCTFAQNTATAISFSVGATGSPVIQLIGGAVSIPTANSAAFVTPTTTTAPGLAILTGVAVTHAAASGTTTLLGTSTGILAIYSGCQFNATGGATLNLATASGTGNPSSAIESGSLLFGFTAGAPAVSTIGIGGNVVVSSSRDAAVNRVSNSSTTYTPDIGRYAWHDVTSSGASFQFVNPTTTPGNLSLGVPRVAFTLRYKNNTAGAITPTFGTNYKIGTAPSVAAGQSATFQFIYDTIGGVFIQVGGNSVSFAA